MTYSTQKHSFAAVFLIVFFFTSVTESLQDKKAIKWYAKPDLTHSVAE